MNGLEWNAYTASTWINQYEMFLFSAATIGCGGMKIPIFSMRQMVVKKLG